MSDLMIEIKDVHKSYTDGKTTTKVLHGVDVSIKTGEFVAIIGQSGSGKSTLLHTAGALDRQYEGLICVDGVDLKTLSDKAISNFRAQKIGFVFQSFNLLPGFSILENVLLPGYFGATKNDAEVLAKKALESVGLGEKTHRRPSEISGGERQRVALARALFTEPPLLLADEPTGNLDQETGIMVLELLKKIHHERKMTMVIVTHEEKVAKAADRIIRVKNGKIDTEVMS